MQAARCTILTMKIHNFASKFNARSVGKNILRNGGVDLSTTTNCKEETLRVLIPN